MRAFYQGYAEFKDYRTPALNAKDTARLDAEVWVPGGFGGDFAVLDLGCGTGRHLAYFSAKGINKLTGVEFDEKAVAAAPEELRGSIHCTDILEFLGKDAAHYNRITCFDILEHFSKEDGLELLKRLVPRLSAGGAVLVKVPNAASPWGAGFQYGDLTHITAFTPDSLAQMAAAAGLKAESFWGHQLGSPARRLRSRILHRILGWLIASPPQIWDGNFFALLRRRPPAG
jgi:SAM-dependent methyltransferase